MSHPRCLLLCSANWLLVSLLSGCLLGCFHPWSLSAKARQDLYVCIFSNPQSVCCSPGAQRSRRRKDIARLGVGSLRSKQIHAKISQQLCEVGLLASCMVENRRRHCGIILQSGWPLFRILLQLIPKIRAANDALSLLPKPEEVTHFTSGGKLFSKYFPLWAPRGTSIVKPMLFQSSPALFPGCTRIWAVVSELLCKLFPGKNTLKAKRQFIRNSSPWEELFGLVWFFFFSAESTCFCDFQLITQWCTHKNTNTSLHTGMRRTQNYQNNFIKSDESPGISAFSQKLMCREGILRQAGMIFPSCTLCLLQISET